MSATRLSQGELGGTAESAAADADSDGSVIDLGYDPALGFGPAATAPLVIGLGDLKDYLGRPRFTPDSVERTSVPGVATGLAVTGAGGDVLYIAANAAEGERSLTLT